MFGRAAITLGIGPHSSVSYSAVNVIICIAFILKLRKLQHFKNCLTCNACHFSHRAFNRSVCAIVRLSVCQSVTFVRP